MAQLSPEENRVHRDGPLGDSTSSDGDILIVILSGLEGSNSCLCPSFSSSSCSSSSKKWRIKSKNPLVNLGLQAGLWDSWESSHVSVPSVWSSTDFLQLYLNEKVLNEELLWLLRQASKDLCQSLFQYETHLHMRALSKWEE